MEGENQLVLCYAELRKVMEKYLAELIPDDKSTITNMQIENENSLGSSGFMIRLHFANPADVNPKP